MSATLHFTPTMQKISDAINAAWIAAYPQAEPVTEEKALCNRVRLLAVDRAEWVKNARALQKDNTELRKGTT